MANPTGINQYSKGRVGIRAAAYGKEYRPGRRPGVMTLKKVALSGIKPKLGYTAHKTKPGVMVKQTMKYRPK